MALDSADTDDLARVLSSEGFAPRRVPLISQVGDHSFIQLMYTPKGRYEDIPVDLLMADSDFLRAALQRVVPTRLGTLECGVVSCEDLILLKLQADRLIDRMDVRYLLEYNRPTLDFAYLLKWIGTLQLQKESSEWWGQAFPDEPAPE